MFGGLLCNILKMRLLSIKSYYFIPETPSKQRYPDQLLLKLNFRRLNIVYMSKVRLVNRADTREVMNHVTLKARNAGTQNSLV